MQLQDITNTVHELSCHCKTLLTNCGQSLATARHYKQVAGDVLQLKFISNKMFVIKCRTIYICFDKILQY